MKNSFKVLAMLGLVLVMLGSLMSCTIIDAQSAGVKTNLGQIQGGVVSSGMYWFVPFVEGYNVYSLLPREVDYDMKVGQDGGITRDNQTVGASMKGFYRYKKEAIVSLYRDFGEDKVSSLFTSAMRQSVKAIIGQYTIFEVAANQDKIRNQVSTELANSIAQLPIELTDIRITNYDWGDEFDKQIKATMEKAQQAKQAEQELIIVTTNAKKGVAQAEADKAQAILRAESEKQQAILSAEAELASAKLRADAKVAEGEGVRKYNAAIASNLDVQIKLKALDIEMTKAQKWDGHYVANNNYGPIPVSTGTILGK